MVSEVERGVPLPGLYPPNDEAKARYEAWKRAKPSDVFFVLAKILGFFSLPSNILISLGLLGIVLTATRFARAGAGSRSRR